MKKLFVILFVLFVGAVITLKVTSRKDQSVLRTTPEALPRTTTQPHRPGIARARPGTSQAANAEEKHLREKLKEDGSYARIFAKEAEWREKFKGLNKGMTVQEAVAVMGEPPTFLLAVTNRTGTPEMAPFFTNELQFVKSHAYLFYSPDDLPPKDVQTGELRPNRLPLDFFELQFDIQGRLYSMIDNCDDPRERLRRELSEDARGREMLAKEAEWKEKSKALREGLTMQEVVAVMGRPTVAPTEIGSQTMLDYLPRGETSLFKMSGGSAVENLTLTFDSTGKLEKIKWW